MMTPKEFTKKFNTCSAKWSLIFSYRSAAEINTWEEMDFTGFAIIRNYSEFCYLDFQRLLVTMYPDQDHDWDSLGKKLINLDLFLNMMLDSLDKRPT